MQTDKPVQRAPIPRLAVSPPPITTTPRSVPGIVPELHFVVAENGKFLLSNNDGKARVFLNLAIGSDPHHAIAAFYDPAVVDECQVFDAWRSQAPALTQLDQKRYRGGAILLNTVDHFGNIFTEYLTPSELDMKAWEPAETAPLYLSCYFRDKGGRLAFGYRDDNRPGEHRVKSDRFTIISGPDDIVPLEWHRAHPECASQATAASVATAQLTGGVQ